MIKNLQAIIIAATLIIAVTQLDLLKGPPPTPSKGGYHAAVRCCTRVPCGQQCVTAKCCAAYPPLEGVGGGPLTSHQKTGDSPLTHRNKSATALYLDSIGLVDISDLDPTIAVSLLYATADNFTGKVLYPDLKEAYLHPEAATALLKAQRLLKEIHSGYTLIIYDAVRPMSVQQKMWDLVKGTSKNIYVSNPARGGGLHNYGLAVDVSILDESGKPLSMGTEVDHLGYEAHINNEEQLVQQGILTRKEKKNRELLRQVMRGAGFRALHSEWWHFNLYSREVAKKKYKLIP